MMYSFLTSLITTLVGEVLAGILSVLLRKETDGPSGAQAGRRHVRKGIPRRTRRS